MSVVQKMGEYTPVECFFGGRDSVKRGMPKLTQQVVIGTPGTIIDVRLISSTTFYANAYYSIFQMVTKSRVLDLTNVKVFVLDEADNMLDSGTMGEQSIQVKKYAHRHVLHLAIR